MSSALPRALARLWADHDGADPVSAERMSPHASGREIYRLTRAGGGTVIGVNNADSEENRTFIEYSRAFRAGGLPVPEIVAWDGGTAYLETDFGDVTLFDHLERHRTADGPSDETQGHYAQAVSDLVAFQTRGLELLRASGVLAHDRFDVAAMMDDYVYFTEEFADRIGLHEEAAAASDGFAGIVARLGTDTGGAFLYRDFQARNIMVAPGGLHYIDYQSGREGPLGYDLASLLFQARADLPFDFRDDLVERYIAELPGSHAVAADEFRKRFRDFVLLRAIQTMGAYGRFGLGQRKDYFLGAIPFAQANAAYLAERLPADEDHRSLRRLLEKVSVTDVE